MRKILAFSLVVSLFIPIQQAHALFSFGVVFDPKNFAQNLLTASRTMMMIRNQITSLQHEIRSLENMAKNLKKLGFNSLPQLQRSLSQVHLIIQDAQGMAMEVATIEAHYQALYPQDYNTALSRDTYVQEARQRWQHSRAAVADSLKTQATILSSIKEDEQLWQQLVDTSQTSEGALQVGQVTNQILALRAQQEAKSQQLAIMQYRADALEKARLLAEKEQARVLRARFLEGGSSYTPIPIKLN